MKQSTTVLGFGRVAIGDSIEYDVDMYDTGVASHMKIEVKITQIENDDTIHFCGGFGTIKLREK